MMSVDKSRHSASLKRGSGSVVRVVNSMDSSVDGIGNPALCRFIKFPRLIHILYTGLQYPDMSFSECENDGPSLAINM
jgi:hypothetical protein